MLSLDFSRPLVMGILNLTPDSFTDGGKFFPEGEDAPLRRFRSSSPMNGGRHPRVQMVLNRIDELIQQGADIIDIGAESTFGPESQVSVKEEWGRLEPVLAALSLRGKKLKANDRGNLLTVPFISIDTYKAEVAEKALKMGVQMINDVTALRGDEKMVEVLVKYQPYVCLMFSADETPYASRSNHQYDDVMKTVSEFLKKQTDKLIQAGFPKEKIIIDPGLGFFLSSDPAVSWEVIERLAELKSLGFPILIGPSMKSFLGGEIQERGQRSLEAAQKCIDNGANVLRVHDVENTHGVITPSPL